jgi:hypothetical protein
MVVEMDSCTFASQSTSVCGLQPFAGMTTRGYQIQVNLNLVTYSAPIVVI